MNDSKKNLNFQKYDWWYQSLWPHGSCFCCGYKYWSTALVNMQYECNQHSYTFCIACAEKHLNCPVDNRMSKPNSLQEFNRKYEHVYDAPIDF